MSAATGNPQLDDLIHREQSAISCPYPIFAGLRDADGLTFHPELGAWIVTRYDDVRAILRDTDRFSSLNPTGPQAAGEALRKGIMELMQDASRGDSLARMSRGRGAVLLNADPPDHRRQRRLVNPAFRPHRIRGFEPAIVEITDRLLADIRADLAAGQVVDIVTRFSVGVPMAIIAMALGVADDDLARFKRWSDDIVMPVGNHSPSLEQIRGFVTSTREFTDYFLAEIADRKREPREDLRSDIANAEIDGEALTDDEQLGMLQQFLVAGNETTTTLIANMIRHLAQDPALQERVRADSAQVDVLVEEMLRLEAPVGGLFRQAKVDVEIAGTTVRAGEHLWIVFASANRDGCKFADPDRVDLDRENVKEHLAFGNGEHFCPGAGLARTEARIAIGRLLAQFDDLRLAPANEFPFGDSFVLRGLTSRLVTATPRS
ncbi:MAG: cytochrome P450 [Actinomycetota bacterium]